MKENNLFGQFYKVARKKYKNDSQLAKALGISRGTLGYYIKYDRSPTLKTLERWCLILNISYSKNIFKINDK